MKKKVKFNKYFILLLLVLGVFVVYSISNINFNPTGKVISENEATSTTTKTTSYVYAGGLAASYDSEGKEKYHINDHLGGTGVVINETGGVVGSDEYYAFGEEKLSTGNEKFTYTGKELDDTELYYYGVRYYDAGIGRFTQPDPLIGGIENPQSLNRYAYTLNNPLKYVDPSGMTSQDWNSFGEKTKNSGPPTTTGEKVIMGGLGVIAGGAVAGLAMGITPYALGWALANSVTATGVGVSAVETATGYGGPSVLNMGNIPGRVNGLRQMIVTREAVEEIYNTNKILQTLNSLEDAMSGASSSKRLNLAQQAVGEVERFGLDVEFLPENELLKLTNNPRNMATIRGETIYISNGLEPKIGSDVYDTKILAGELGHETGAYILNKKYGGIPRMENEGGWATHYLDITPNILKRR